MVKKTDDYKPTKFYQDHAPSEGEGFTTFKVGKSWYFTFLDDGDVLLLSESYTSEAGRDNGVKSVTENMQIEDNYRYFKRGRWHYFKIVAANGHEVARSRALASEEEARRLMSVAQDSQKPAFDNYRPLAFYQDHIRGKEEGFTTFNVDDDYYFTYSRDGKVLLISETYTSAAARDNGVGSVKENMKTKDRYYPVALTNGKNEFRLKATNNQEIARSVWYGSEPAAMKAAMSLYDNATPTLDDYRPLAFYQSRTDGKDEGFSTFEDDGEHYFTYSRGGDILMISETYGTEAARDNGVDSVKTNMRMKERYDYATLTNGKYEFRLKAGNNHEIARSRWFDTKSAAKAAVLALLGRQNDNTAVAAAAPVKIIPETTATETVVNRKDVEIDEGAKDVSAAAIIPPTAEHVFVTEAAPVTTPVSTAGAVPVRDDDREKGWLWWLLPLLLLLGLLLFGLSRCSPENSAPFVAANVENRIIECRTDLERFDQDVMINFSFDGTRVASGGEQAIIDNLAKTALSCDGFDITVIGHTDAVGSKNYNEELGLERAEAVAKVLINGGVDESRIETVTRGEDRPIATNQTAEGRADNRRVTFNVDR